MSARGVSPAACIALGLLGACAGRPDCVPSMEGITVSSTESYFLPEGVLGESAPWLYYVIRTNHRAIPSADPVAGTGVMKLSGDSDCGWYVEAPAYLEHELSCHDTHVEVTFTLELLSDWDPALAEQMLPRTFLLDPMEGDPGVLELWEGLALDTRWLELMW